MQIRLTDQADSDLFSIWAHIAGSSLRNADRCVDRIMKATARLADFPKSSPIRVDIAAEARALTVERWLVIYRLTAREIVVVRIVDAARDVRRLGIPPE